MGGSQGGCKRTQICVPFVSLSQLHSRPSFESILRFPIERHVRREALVRFRSSVKSSDDNRLHGFSTERRCQPLVWDPDAGRKPAQDKLLYQTVDHASSSADESSLEN